MARYYRNRSSSDDVYYTSPNAAIYALTENAIDILDTSSNSWLRSGYRLKEWNTNDTGTGTTYHIGDEVPTTYTNLYAVWEPCSWTPVRTNCTVIPTSYDAENSNFDGTPTNPENGLTDSSSTTYGRFYTNTGSNKETSIYYDLGVLSAIPDGATIDLLNSSQYKVYISDSSGNARVFQNKEVQFCVETTEGIELFGSSGSFSNDTTQRTLVTYFPISAEDVKKLKIRTYAKRGGLDTSTSYYIRFYGANTTINYTYYTIPCTIYSDVIDVTVDSNTFDAIENQYNDVTISNPYGKKIAIYDNGVITATTSNITYTYSFYATEIHNIVIQENYFYVKPNGKWLTGQAAYKKTNGSWVEQSNLSTVFTNQENYEYKGSLLYTENPFFSAFEQMDLVANAGYGAYSDDGSQGLVWIDLDFLQQNATYYALGSYDDNMILSKFTYDGSTCNLTNYINFVNGSDKIRFIMSSRYYKPEGSSSYVMHNVLYLSPRASGDFSSDYDDLWGGTLLIFKIKDNSIYNESQINTIFSSPPTITVKYVAYGEGPTYPGFTMTENFYCMVMWKAYFAMNYVYNDTHTRVRLIGNGETYGSSVSNPSLLGWGRATVFMQDYTYAPSIYNSETTLGSIGASVSVFQIS